MILYITDRNIRVDNADNQISYNSDYIAEFRFDDEWDGKIKTARFVQNGEHVDVVLVDDRCDIPPLKTGFVRVGVFTDLMTSTYADVYFKTSIKDGGGNPTEPPEDVYAQLTSLIESGMLKGDSGYTPKKGVDYWTEEDIENIVNIPAREEEKRKSNEAERTAAEDERKSSETSRINAETLRNESETIRTRNETLRDDAEKVREKAEKKRESSEASRAAAEDERKSAETSRINAEIKRAEDFSKFNERLNTLENDFESLGLSVVNGQLCTTWEE